MPRGALNEFPVNAVAPVAGSGLYLRPVEVSGALYWTVRQQVVQSQSYSWTVRQVLALTNVMTWTVRQSVAQPSPDLLWMVRAPVLAPLDASWTVRQQVASVPALRWTVRQIMAGVSLRVRWDAKSPSVPARWPAAGLTKTPGASRLTRWGAETNAIVTEKE